MSGKRLLQIALAGLLVLAIINQPHQSALTATLIFNHLVQWVQNAGSAVLTFLTGVTRG